MLRLLPQFLICCALIVGCTSCVLDADESSSAGKLVQLPYAQDLQQAMERALLEGQGNYDLGISAAVIIPGYEPFPAAQAVDDSFLSR